jgi:hypothetical protein
MEATSESILICSMALRLELPTFIDSNNYDTLQEKLDDYLNSTAYSGDELASLIDDLLYEYPRAHERLQELINFRMAVLACGADYHQQLQIEVNQNYQTLEKEFSNDLFKEYVNRGLFLIALERYLGERDSDKIYALLTDKRILGSFALTNKHIQTYLPAEDAKRLGILNFSNALQRFFPSSQPLQNVPNIETQPSINFGFTSPFILDQDVFERRSGTAPSPPSTALGSVGNEVKGITKNEIISNLNDIGIRSAKTPTGTPAEQLKQFQEEMKAIQADYLQLCLILQKLGLYS